MKDMRTIEEQMVFVERVDKHMETRRAYDAASAAYSAALTTSMQTSLYTSEHEKARAACERARTTYLAAEEAFVKANIELSEATR